MSRPISIRITSFLPLLGLIARLSHAAMIVDGPRAAVQQNGKAPLDYVEPDMYDWTRHPCRRQCQDEEAPMECRYRFNIEAYWAMSKACYDCPYNRTDCFRPHCVPADGESRPVITVNRQMPGPAIEVCQGDRIIVEATNLMHSESTTLHWHGQHQRLNPYMDGTPFVTQCPILPFNSFTYDFVAEVPGTHFWHSHVGFQRGDGLYGAMIVRQAPKSDLLHSFYDYDEHSVIISDWDHELGLDKFLAHYHSTGDNKPPNLLINGLGRYHRPRNDSAGSPVFMPTAEFVVQKDGRHRFRIINAEFLNCPIEFSIDNHTMLIVSSDGKDFKPVEVQALITYAGERFDVIVEMNQPVDNYWMRFRGLLDCGPNFKKAHQVAVMRYKGASKTDPVAPVAYHLPDNIPIARQLNPLNRGTENKDYISIPKLESLDVNSAANTKKPDYQFYISYDFYAKDNPKFHRKGLYGFHQVKNQVYTPQLNHISMKTPPFTLMAQTELADDRHFCNSSTVEDLDCEINYCSCHHVLQVKLNSVVELILVDEGVPYDANHPFHLHGHDFRVIAMERIGSNVTVDQVKKLDREGRIRRKLDRAPIKDTVTVPDGGFTIIRFVADNPGYWLFHCHIEFHSEIGMALVFKIGEHSDFVPPPMNFPKCGDLGPFLPQTTSTPANLTETSTLIPPSSKSAHPNLNDTLIGNRPHDDITSNDIDQKIDQKVQSYMAKWLPYIFGELKDLHAAKSAGSAISFTQRPDVLGVYVIISSIWFLLSVFERYL